MINYIGIYFPIMSYITKSAITDRLNRRFPAQGDAVLSLLHTDRLPAPQNRDSRDTLTDGDRHGIHSIEQEKHQ